MGLLNKIPKLSLILLIAIYGVFGWLYGGWMQLITGNFTPTYQWLSSLTTEIIAYAVGLVAIVVVITYFTTPINLLTLGMGNWFRADAKAVFSIAISIIIFALVIEFPAMLSRFLILAAAAMLLRLDLHSLGYSRKTSQLILIGFSLVSFTGGILLYNYERFTSYWY